MSWNKHSPRINGKTDDSKKEGGKAGVLEENIEIFSEFLRELRKTTNAAGCHIMAIGFEKTIPKILERAGLKRNLDWRSLIKTELALETQIKIALRRQ